MTRTAMNIRLDLEPVACPRPRVTRTGHSYYPKRYTDFKRAATALLNTMSLHRLTGPVELYGAFVFSIPRSWSKRKQLEMRGTLHVQKPDLDNLVKSVKDVLSGVVYIDDRQVAMMSFEKYWASEGAGFINVSVREIRPRAGSR